MDKDWRGKVSFPINFISDSDDDDDLKDVVMRRGNPQSSWYLLADRGDGSEADLLGTTPPRERIRGKEKRKAYLDAAGVRDSRRSIEDMNITQKLGSLGTEHMKKHYRSKLIRLKERDEKKDIVQREYKAESLPSPMPAVPTLVESCNRFMCLTSRLKRRDASNEDAPEEEVETRWPSQDEVPASRVNFHKTFSMLINMGNMEKGCKRTISREEQVWQNELKDLIWLELQAKIAGRTLAQQDAFLCAQRDIVPTIIHNIRNYRFVNPNPCTARTRRLRRIEGSRDDLTTNNEETETNKNDTEDDEDRIGCISFNCQQCSDAIGKAMREVGTLLDSFYNAGALYPSSKAMTHEHPQIATQLFKNRLKAMCLWYNTALYMRLKVVAVRRMVRTMRHKSHRGMRHLPSTDSDFSRQSSEQRPCQVRFNVSTTPTDSNNSDSSGHSEMNPEQKDSGSEEQETVEKETQDGNEEHAEGREDEVDSGNRNGQTTPEIVLDSKYGTSDTIASTESGYSTALECDVSRQHDDVYDIGSLEDVTRLRLLDKCSVSPYRDYHQEMLKTQGVRRCMMFMNKMRLNVLGKVYLTLEKPDRVKAQSYAEEDPVEVFDDTKEDEDKTVEDDDTNRAYELRRYGCWSEECLAMCLPSYRNHFLLLSSIVMEAAHDYLSLRLEDRPQNPSCLTVKQLIHELKEGLDIATEVRAGFARNVEVALAGLCAATGARADLLLLVRTYDATVETVLKQYLSYLRTMSEVEHLSRSTLQAEWSFTARLAKRIKCAALLAPVTFSEIACNQLNRVLRQFTERFRKLKEVDAPDSRQLVYTSCREAQSIYACEREPTLQAAQWARALAARLARAPAPAYAAQRADIFEALMSLRDCLVRQTRLMLERTRVAHEELARELDAALPRVRDLLLQVYRLGFDIHKELHRFVNDSSSQRQSAANQWRGVNSSPPRGRGNFMRSESIGEDGETNALDDRLFENINNFADNQTSIEILLGLPQPAQGHAEQAAQRAGGAPAQADVSVSEEEQRWAWRVARAVVEFARCWMQFVVERCDTGRGLRPRWASQGLEFLMLACDPCNTKHLTEEEFEELKKEMDGCISHVIGCRPAAARSPDACAGPGTPDARRRPRIHSPLSTSNTAVNKDVPAPPTPPNEPDPLLSFHGLDTRLHSRRVLEAINRLDEERDAVLREKKTVGHVLESAAVSSYEPKLRQLKFKWQRGLKIGAGTFGKVYTVVNTESGQLLAMKELSVGVGDRRALQRAANELRVLEGVIHPHLVRYYGCELHREEMLLFMELCVEGSLEALVATSGALAEHTVRRYTKQLLSAVQELHNRAIVHRDIKSGNIFLTNEGHCLKLGDFGCAVKIRANTTAAGELIGCVGTQAYMAPEVFMKQTGHGRAADIWSLGCVVTEMASGKRPFSEYDSNYQIMFVVGMGGRPAIPDTLSEEGRQFCRACLTHEPEQRPRAHQLALHHFLMVKSDDDCKCEPAFLIT